jgi:hypothetical protein
VWCGVVQKALEDDKVELNRVKKIVGLALKPILGMPDGYYILDLSKEKDRVCLSLLLEQSEYRKTQMIEGSLDGLVSGSGNRIDVVFDNVFYHWVTAIFIVYHFLFAVFVILTMAPSSGIITIKNIIYSIM